MRQPYPHPTTTTAELAAAQLFNAKASAAVGSMSESWWLQKVSEGVAPQPAVRAPRCTRWRAVDVAAFWLAFASQADVSEAESLKARASKASAAACAKRQQAPASALAGD